MKLNDLKKAAARAQQELQLAESKVADLQRTVKAAKANTEQVRLQFKGMRKAAKQAKKLVLAAEEQARERCRVWEKAQKRLAKALKKLVKAKGGGTKKPALAAAAPGKAAPPKPAAKKPSPIPPKTQKPAVASQSPPAAPGAE